MLIFIIIGILVIIGLCFPLVLFIVKSQGDAKKSAKQIIESRQITDWKNFERICKVLSTITNDKEADYLYMKLMEIKEESKAA